MTARANRRRTARRRKNLKAWKSIPRFKPVWTKTVMEYDTDEMTTGPKDDAPNPPRITSAAKKAPAIGALKVAAIPAAAPQPTQIRSRGEDSRSN